MVLHAQWPVTGPKQTCNTMVDAASRVHCDTLAMLYLFSVTVEVELKDKYGAE